MRDRPERLTEEAIEVNERRKNITKLSNLGLQMYSWYVKYGHARNEAEEKKVKKYFVQNLPSNARILSGFYERLYLYQSSCWYAFICQDFLKYYRYAQKWIDLFDEHTVMIAVEPGHYVKGMHNILNAHFDLRNYKSFAEVLHRFEEFAKTDVAYQDENFNAQTFIYHNTQKINKNLIHRSFKECL